MKQLFTILFFFAAANGMAQTKTDSTILVEASCGQCNFGLKAPGCALAIKLNGKAYFVDGTGIDDHGDAHAKDGFCNSIRKAEVKGTIAEGRFKATYFKLLPEKNQ